MFNGTNSSFVYCKNGIHISDGNFSIWVKSVSWWLDSFSFIKELRRSIDGLQYTTIQTRIKPLKWLLSLPNGLIILYIIRNITSVYNLPTVSQIQRIIVHYELYKIRFHTVNQSLRPTQDTEKHFTIADFFFMTKNTASTNHSFNMYNYDFFSPRSNRLQQKKVSFVLYAQKRCRFFYFISFGVYFDVSIWIET